MPIVFEKNLMAEYINCGLGLGNEDLRPSPVFADYFIQSMQDLKCVDLNSLPNRTEDTRTVPLNPSQDTTNMTEEDSNNVVETVDNSVVPDDSTVETLSTDSSVVTEVFREKRAEKMQVKHTQVPSDESFLCFLPANYSKRNPWRRISGFHVTGEEIRSATYPARSSVKKLRFAQAKKPLNYLYSYFSFELIDCDEKSGITIGLSRKGYPNKAAPGKSSGSVGYFSDTGAISNRSCLELNGPQFSKGDIIGCGIIYPSQYKRYADLSTDDNSDGMTDVVLTSLLNKRSMDFVCNVLNLQAQLGSGSPDSNLDQRDATEETDYYNENFVESRTQVEVYFTHNMKVIGKVMSHIPIGGFYPTIHIFSQSAINIAVDLNPPAS